MTAPLTTPLLLLSELRPVSADPAAADVASRMRELIVSASALVQRTCHRRFDEYIKTATYTALPLGMGGDVNARLLYLGRDLRAVLSVTNGDGTVLGATIYLVIAERGDHPATPPGYALQLTQNSGAWWSAGTNDPVDAISVNARWGYGGQWVPVTTLNGDVNDSVTSWTVTGGAACEVGMVGKVDSEYVYLDDVSSDTLTVVRAYNGSPAAAHLTGATFYRWQADELVGRMVKRLCLWSMEQDKSPLAGQVIIGDMAYPVNVNGLPADVLNTLTDAGLIRMQLFGGV